MKKNHYQILGVDEKATPDEIRAAYKKLCQQLHPDKNPDEHAKLLFGQVQKAYKVLIDPASREQYDLTGSDTLDEIKQQAETQVINILREFIQKTIEAHVNGQHGPQFKRVIQGALGKVDESRENKCKLQHALDKAESMAGKITSKGQRNMADSILEDITVAIKQDLDNNERNIQIRELTVKILKQYEHADDPVAAAQGYIHYTTTGATGW